MEEKWKPIEKYNGVYEVSDLESKAKISSANALTQNKTALQAAGVIDLALEGDDGLVDNAVDNSKTNR